MPYHITIERMDSVADHGNVLATAFVAPDADRYSVRLEWLNSLDMFDPDSVSDETFAAMWDFVDKAAEDMADWIESSIDGLTEDSELLVILHGAREFLAMEV